MGRKIGGGLPLKQENVLVGGEEDEEGSGSERRVCERCEWACSV